MLRCQVKMNMAHIIETRVCCKQYRKCEGWLKMKWAMATGMFAVRVRNVEGDLVKSCSSTDFQFQVVLLQNWVMSQMFTNLVKNVFKGR